MACPKCYCKTTYPYYEDEWDSYTDLEKCAYCGHIFPLDLGIDEDDDYQAMGEGGYV